MRLVNWLSGVGLCGLYKMCYLLVFVKLEFVAKNEHFKFVKTCDWNIFSC